MLARAVEAFRLHPLIDDVIVVIGRGQDQLARDAVGDLPLVIGGATRRESVANGLVAVRSVRVLVHDAARPFVPAAVIDRVVAALDDAVAVTPALAVADTLVRGDRLLGEVVLRDGLWCVQTPQGFDTATLRRAHAAWDATTEATDDAQMVRALGLDVALVQGDPMLDKVTQAQDFAMAEARAGWEWRSATGFDVHRLEAGEELWLGGVLVPHDRGLSGHSDADVALHALTDALLGTIAAGDIGTHFPPTDPQWAGVASHRFLTHAAALIAAKGGQIAFVDLTIICEAPRIGPHRAAMQARIAELLALSPERVSIKATTTERLGFTGRGEGIAAQASATVRLPGVRAVAAVALMLASTPASAQQPCLSSVEAESLAAVALPEILRQTGVVCAAQLSATSPLRRRASPLLKRYDAEADRAWPAARAAIVKLSNPTAEALLVSAYARPLLAALVAPLIVGRIAARDCDTIDRLVTLLEPLPPRNTAGVIVAALRYAKRVRTGERNPVAALPLCMAETR